MSEADTHLNGQKANIPRRAFNALAAGSIFFGIMSGGVGWTAGLGWPQYGGDLEGTRHSTSDQLTPANVAKLREVWRYSTGAATRHARAIQKSSFEATPILDEGKLFICSPFDEVSALDPGTGRLLWHFDPHINDDPHVDRAGDFTCRGVAYWKDTTGNGRIYVATLDRRIIALYAATGKPVESFGLHGTITVDAGSRDLPEHMNFTSGPLLSHGVVIVGASVADNKRLKELPGIVHAFDAMTGAPKWNFDPLENSHEHQGAANVWAPMSADENLGLVYLPTTSPSPDYWGGQRVAEDKYTTAVVALHVETGQVAWSFQVVHHNLWDYDLPAQPTLATVTYMGRAVPALLQPTKQGLLFTLDRRTGAPVIPVVERQVPQNGAPGEHPSRTQPFPVAPKALSPSQISEKDAFGLTFWDREKCRSQIAMARHEGLFTLPSLDGTISYPSAAGGMNWGGLSFDPAHNIAYVNTMNAMHLITLIPAAKLAAARKANKGNVETSPNTGAPFGMQRKFMLSPFGMPCNPPPWGSLHAIDMNQGRELWSAPLGTTEDIFPFSEYVLGKTGTPNLGGPVSTAGGLVFIGAAMDNYLRAFDAKMGKELWRGRLPAGGQATPMTYMWKGRQFVVIAAGGNSKLDTKRGDQVIAFALPE